MRRLILTAMIAGLLAPAGLHAQRVYKEGSKVILDLTVEAGMPAGAITSDRKTPFYEAYVPDNNVFGTINNQNNDAAHPLNARVYRKLEVSLTEGAAGTYAWADGFKYCKDLDEAGSSDWRLPTQRELILIHIFQPALNQVIEKLDGTALLSTPLTTVYWSATEYNANVSWGMYVFGYIDNSGENNLTRKTGKFRARCVREL